MSVTSAVSALAVRIAQEIKAVRTEMAGMGGSATGFPDDPPTSPDVMDDEFTGTVLAAKWTIINGCVPVVRGSRLEVPAEPVTGWNLRGIGQAIPTSGDFTFTARFAGGDSASASFNLPMLMGLAEGTAAQRFALVALPNDSGPSCLTLNSVTSFASSFGTTIPYNGRHGMFSYFRVSRAGSSYNFDTSRTGRRFYRVGSLTLPYTPTRVVLAANSENTTYGVTGVWDYFRRTA